MSVQDNLEDKCGRCGHPRRAHHTVTPPPFEYSALACNRHGESALRCLCPGFQEPLPNSMVLAEIKRAVTEAFPGERGALLNQSTENAFTRAEAAEEAVMLVFDILPWHPDLVVIARRLGMTLPPKIAGPLDPPSTRLGLPSALDLGVLCPRCGAVRYGDPNRPCPAC